MAGYAPATLYPEREVEDMDLTGQRFGRLTVIERVPHKRKDAYWLCRCDCGGETTTNTYSLRSGHTTSCGCYNREKVAENGRRTKRYNKYSTVGGTVFVELDKSNTMLCDKDDWERFKHIKWSVGTSGYASGRDTEKCKTVYYHRVLMGFREGLVIDHINRNRLDNRKCNLRFVTQRVNMLNKSLEPVPESGKVGVCFHHGKWEAAVWDHKKRILIGRFETKEEAIKAREEAEEKYYKPLFED